MYDPYYDNQRGVNWNYMDQCFDDYPPPNYVERRPYPRGRVVPTGRPWTPPEPVDSLAIRYKEDPAEHKVNLGIGTYQDYLGNPYVFNAVWKAETEIKEQDRNIEIPPASDANLKFLLGAKSHLFGWNHRDTNSDRIISIPTLDTHGALRIAAEFISENQTAL